MPKYFIMQSERIEDYTAIGRVPRGMRHIHKPATGIRMGDSYQDGQAFDMDEDTLGLKVADVIHNMVGYLMVSPRMKALLEQHAKAEIEFLRFTLMNHKKRVESDTCYIANVIGGKDWTDMEKSEGKMNALYKDRFMIVHRLVLKEEVVGPEANLFRLSAAPRLMIVREDLKALFDSEGVIGAEFFEVGTPINLLT